MSAKTYGPGLHDGVDELVYHALPGLSSTGVKRMLEAPAVYHWHTQHPQPFKKAFEVGHAVHGKVLGVGLDAVVVPAEMLAANGAASTKEAKAFIKDARDAGKVVLKQEEWDRVDAMAEAVLAHPDASYLVANGMPEASLIWDDPDTSVRCRGRLDYWHEGPYVAVDLKTVQSADPGRFARHAADLGYDVQAGHYQDGTATALGERLIPRFLHVLVAKEPPHLVSVVELDPTFLDIGQSRARQAIQLYAKCAAEDNWPGIAPGIHRIAPPRWHRVAEDTDLYEEYAS